jgi:hypothetical protein
MSAAHAVQQLLLLLPMFVVAYTDALINHQLKLTSPWSPSKSTLKTPKKTAKQRHSPMIRIYSS